MGNFVDIWMVFNLAFLKFMIYSQTFWIKIEIITKNVM